MEHWLYSKYPSSSFHVSLLFSWPATRLLLTVHTLYFVKYKVVFESVCIGFMSEIIVTGVLVTEYIVENCTRLLPEAVKVDVPS